MAEAPAWLDCAPKEPAAPVLFRRPRGRRQARAALDRACTKILAAPNGEQDDTRHRECFRIGELIERGDLDLSRTLARNLAARSATHSAAEPTIAMARSRGARRGVDRERHGEGRVMNGRRANSPGDGAEPALAEGGERACDELVKRTEKEPGAPYGVVATSRRSRRPIARSLKPSGQG